jgi:hypothetical protein
MAEDCLLPGLCEGLLWRKLTLKSIDQQRQATQLGHRVGFNILVTTTGI